MAERMSDLGRLDRPPPLRPTVFQSRLRGAVGRAVCRAYGVKAVIEGQETYRLGDRTRVLNPGEFMVVPPGQAFEIGVAGGQETVGLCIDLPPAEVVVMGGGDAEALGCDAVFRLDDESIGEALAKTWRATGELEAAPAGLCRLVATWLRGHGAGAARIPAQRTATQSELYARVERARQFIHDHRNERIALAQLARQVHLSASHLNRAFRQVHGEPPIRYHRRLRLEAAADQLRRGSATPTELAAQLGYADLPTFTRAFRRVHGAPPSAYRGV